MYWYRTANIICTVPEEAVAGARGADLTFTPARTWKIGRARLRSSTTTDPSGPTGNIGPLNAMSTMARTICWPALRTKASAAARRFSGQNARKAPLRPLATALSHQGIGNAWTVRCTCPPPATPGWSSAMNGCKPATARSVPFRLRPTFARQPVRRAFSFGQETRRRSPQ